MTELHKHLLTTWQWVCIIAVLVGATVTHVGSINAINSRFHDDLVQLDTRWQDRTEQLSREIRQEIRDVKKSSPPGWLQEIVERNTAEIIDLRSKVGRE